MSAAWKMTRVVMGAGVCAMLWACGGGDDPIAPPSADQPPVITVQSPAEGATFRAGDTLEFNASVTDREEGAIAATRVTWRLDLHTPTQVRPVVPTTRGVTGRYAIPVRLDPSPDITYRLTVRATDAAGNIAELVREIVPLRSQVTLATQPPGLTLTLDGVAVTAPHTFTGVQGVARDLSAAEQVVGGRRYAFTGWSDGGAAAHTLSTPSADTTITATFTDQGTTDNQPPTVSLSAVASAVVGTPIALTAAAADADGSVARVQFFDGATLLGEDTSAPYTFSWTPATEGVHQLTARATDDDGDSTTSAAVAVTVAPVTGPDNEAPLATLTSPTAFASGLSGTVNVTATATDNVGVTAMVFQVDGTALGAEVIAAPWQASWDTTAWPAGQHVVRARARDAAGNWSDWASVTVQVASSAGAPPGLAKTENWISGLNGATAFVQASDGRFFVAEQGGRVRVVKNGQLLNAAFLDLNVDDRGERGLIGITLHPNFPSTNWVYVHYTTRSGGAHNRLARYPALGDAAIELLADRLVDLPVLSNATNHNGGAIHFGADGKLYVGVGDNADSSHAPDLTTPFGKLLRFNDDGSIPNDNPHYATQSGVARAIWARGLRNPFTFAVQPGTGRIHVNDVGQSAWEEINLGTAGADFGWPATEGPTTAAGVTAPLFSYGHDPATPPGSGPGGFFNGLAIAGGAFYPSAGGSFPAAYRGSYFFADYGSGIVGRLDAANANAAYAVATVQDNPVDMLVGQDGALYVLTRSGITRIAPP